MKRKFDGIWIPKEIWLHKGLSGEAKFLWGEIQSHYCDEREGCSQSDSYLMKFIDVNLSKFEKVINELREEGLVVIRQDKEGRVLKAIDPNEAVPANKENLVPAR
ncbi:MAG: hypothetical protein ACRDAI_01210 [Candidatus Rhabdochlamydia sp.]